MMSPAPYEPELELARRLEALEARASSRGGFATAINRIFSHVPPMPVIALLAVFVVWLGWGYVDRWQELSAATIGLQAKAAALAADAETKGVSVEEPLQVQAMRAEIAKLAAEIATTKAEGDRVRAEADAQNAEINKVKIAVLQKRAEVAAAEAQATIEQMKFLTGQLRNAAQLGWR
jgi:nucleotide-binding universal stress UspA family protein